MDLSIIIPARNEQDVIATCIRNCLDKGARPYEIIIVNDGSTDRTRDFVEMMRIKNPELKLINFDASHSAAYARNRGAEKATGDILLFIDADMEITTEDYVKKIAKVFENPQVVGGQLEGTAEYKTFLQKCQHVRTALTVNKMGRKGVIYLNAIRRDIFEKINGFDEKLFYYEDRDIAGRAREYGKIVELPVNALHKEPSTFNDFLRQAKWVGKGRKTYKKDMHFNIFMPWDVLTAYKLTNELTASLAYIFILQPIRLGMILMELIR